MCELRVQVPTLLGWPNSNNFDNKRDYSPLGLLLLDIHVLLHFLHTFLKGLASSSISPSVSATCIAFVHKILSWPDPTDNFIAKKLREGYRRQHYKPDSTCPITANLLQKLCHVRFHCIVRAWETFTHIYLPSVLWFFRVGEITAKNKCWRDTTNCISVSVYA